MQGFDDSHARDAAGRTENLHPTRPTEQPEGFGRKQLVGLTVLIGTLLLFVLYLSFK